MKKRDLYDGLYMLTYTGRELSELSKEKKEKIATCYMNTFNESWEESWTIETAFQHVEESFRYDGKRLPIASVVFDRNTNVAGFAWGVIANPDALLFDKDMPFSLNIEEKKQGIEISKYWLTKILKKETVLMYSEFGALKAYRGRLAPYLTVDVLESALNLNCQAMILWTNIKSSVFTLSLGIEWFPIHFFITQDLVLFGGSVKNSYEITKSMSEAKVSDESYERLFHNMNKYLCN